MTDIPHLKTPIRFANGAVDVVEQDTLDEIAQCVDAVLRCPLGFRAEKITFGIYDQTFAQGGADVDSISDSVGRWERRADDLIESDPDAIFDMASRLTVKVRGPYSA